MLSVYGPPADEVDAGRLYFSIPFVDSQKKDVGS